MKKCIALVLSILLILSLFGCGNGFSGDEKDFHYFNNEKPEEQDYSGQIISFVYRFEREGGPEGRFELIKDGDGAIFRAWDDYYSEGDEPYEARVNKSVLRDLKELIDRCGITRYNGVAQGRNWPPAHSSFWLEAVPGFGS